MIEFVRGRLAEKAPTRLVLDVGGMGLGLEVSLRTGASAGALGETLQLHAYLHVREEALDLYGFQDGAEKALFLKLIGVSGVGPRLALRILSALPPAQLVAHILAGDVRALTALKGVGKKTAEMLVASLRASLSKLDLPESEAGSGSLPTQEGPYRDAVLALITLGVKEAQAQEAVRKAAGKLGEASDSSRLIAQALQEV